MPLDRVHWAAEFATVARRYAGRTAVADETGEITYGELFHRAAALADRLVASGVRPGEPVATCLRNGIPAVWASYGTVLSGAAETALNPGLSEADRHHCLTLAGVCHVVTEAASAAFFRGLGLTVHLAEDIGEAELVADRFPAVDGEAWGKIGFTSGTTGLPKGVVHDQHGRWLSSLLLRASLPRTPGRDGRLLLMTPFSHGASLMTYAYLDRGGSVMLLEGVDAQRVLRLVGDGVVDEMFAPPTVLAKIVAEARGGTFAGLKTIFCGTAVLSPTLYARARETFGPIVRVTYGKSEVFNPITVLDPSETDAWYTDNGPDADACVGWPASGVELRVRGDEGIDAAPGEVGEIAIRARHMMAGLIRAGGYEPLPAGAFHDTGDLGYLDASGRLHLVGRAAHVMKTGGYKVAPEEVERALAPALEPSEVAAFGIPSEYWGEVIVAAVESPLPGWAERLRDAGREVTSYKRPRAVVAVDELPRNAMGKLDRARLRERVLASHRLVDGPRPRLAPRAVRVDGSDLGE